MRQMHSAVTGRQPAAAVGSRHWLGPALPQRRSSSADPQRSATALQRGQAVAAEPPRMRSLRGGTNSAQPQYGGRNGATAVPGSAGMPTDRQPLYRGNLSGPSNNVEPTTAVRPEDVRAANKAGDPAAAAAVATASKPVVKFVPKRISLWDAMKFNGPAPEIIQGRLAMVGFIAGAVQEAKTGQTLLQQAAHLSPGTLFWLALIVVASLQPITRAAKSEPFGWFTPRAEIVNGRAAMLGFAIVAALEWNAGVCFF